MGWTSYHATHYKKNGTIDRKAECDAYFMEGLNRGYYEVLKSAMVGSTYYAAVKALKRYQKGSDEKIVEDIPEEEQKVWAVVFLTLTDKKDYYNFSYKPMDEFVGPCESCCPKAILNLLSPTDEEWALDWRKRCLDNIAMKKNPDALSNLPIGTVIRFTDGSGEKVELLKHRPAYQFKRPFWYCEAEGTYMSAKYIPENYEIVKRGEIA